MNGITSKKERGKSRTGISFERFSASSRTDFRFAPVNVLLLVAFYVARLLQRSEFLDGHQIIDLRASKWKRRTE